MPVNKVKSKLADTRSYPQVVDVQAAITAPTGGATIDAESRTAINAIITVLEAHGLVLEN